MRPKHTMSKSISQHFLKMKLFILKAQPNICSSPPLKKAYYLKQLGYVVFSKGYSYEIKLCLHWKLQIIWYSTVYTAPPETAMPVIIEMKKKKVTECNCVLNNVFIIVLGQQ